MKYYRPSEKSRFSHHFNALLRRGTCGSYINSFMNDNFFIAPSYIIIIIKYIFLDLRVHLIAFKGRNFDIFL